MRGDEGADAIKAVNKSNRARRVLFEDRLTAN
jgi:hypothetical protein